MRAATLSKLAKKSSVYLRLPRAQSSRGYTSGFFAHFPRLALHLVNLAMKLSLRPVLITLAVVWALVGGAPVSAEQDVFTYKVKGIVKVLPHKGTASNEIIVQHEAIPDYRDDSGTVVGMSAMTMPFYLASGVKLDAVGVGDKVEMVLEQRLKPRFTEQVVSLTRIQ